MHHKFPSLLPLLPNRVWRTYLGGRTLDQMEGKQEPVDSHFPEDWILSTTPAINKGREDHLDEGISRVMFDGRDCLLTELLEQDAAYFLGQKHIQKYGVNAGFLLKYLDSSVRLHIQCHPTIAFSQQYLNANAGKTEGYIILGSREDVDPYIYMGFQRSPDTDAFRKAIVEQDTPEILSYFDRIPVKPGDVFLVPGGLPHAIGEGVFMVEIMEPTDFAVRIEFERGGYLLPQEARFMGRDVDFALSMFDFSSYNLEQLRSRFFVEPALIKEDSGNEQWSLFDDRYTSCFRAQRVHLRDRMCLTHDCMRVLIVTHGAGEIHCGEMVLKVRAGQRILIPYQIDTIELVTAEGMQAVIVMPPE